MGLVYFVFFMLLMIKMFGGEIAWWEVMIPLWIILVGTIAGAFLHFLEDEKKNV